MRTKYWNDRPKRSSSCPRTVLSQSERIDHRSHLGAMLLFNQVVSWQHYRDAAEGHGETVRRAPFDHELLQIRLEYVIAQRL